VKTDDAGNIASCRVDLVLYRFSYFCQKTKTNLGKIVRVTRK